MFKGVCLVKVSWVQIIDSVYQYYFHCQVRGMTSFALSYTCTCRLVQGSKKLEFQLALGTYSSSQILPFMG